jgi:hypothetical protein
MPTPPGLDSGGVVFIGGEWEVDARAGYLYPAMCNDQPSLNEKEFGRDPIIGQSLCGIRLSVAV